MLNIIPSISIARFSFFVFTSKYVLFSQCRSKIDRQENKVFVWGLNDKEQLGGIKGSKMKFPAFSESLSALKPIHIAGGSKTLFVVSYNGKVCNFVIIKKRNI